MIVRSGRLPAAILLLAVVLNLVVALPRARAEGSDLKPEPGGMALGAELGYSATEQPGSTAHVGVAQWSLAYALDARWSVAADLALSVLSSDPDRGDAEVIASPANPTLLGYFRPGWGLAFGAGMALPVADLGSGSVARLHRVAYNLAAAMSGLGRLWLWSPGRAAAVTTAQWQGALGSELELGVELWPTVLWRAMTGVGGNAVDVYMPSGAKLFVTRSSWLQPGLGLSAVWLLTNKLDRLQTALEPQLRVVLPAVTLKVRYLIALDEPLAGPRGTQPWALHVSGEGRL